MIAPIDLLSLDTIVDRVSAAIEDPAADRAIRRIMRELAVAKKEVEDVSRARGLVIGYVAALWYETEEPRGSRRSP